MIISLPESFEEIKLKHLAELVEIESQEEQADYILREISNVNPTKVDPSEKLPILAVFTHLIKQKKLVSAPWEIETNSMKMSVPENLLKIKVKHFVELVNLDLTDGYKNHHVLAALMYREDWSKPFDEDEVIDNAKMFWESSSKFGIWAAELFEKLITLLKNTYPILYEKKESEKSEGRRAYGMLNGLAQDNPTQWEKAENLELWRAFTWMELKAIQRDNEKQ